MNRRQFLAASATPAAGWTFAAAQKKGAIKLVSSLPRTGSSKSETDGIVNGIRMAMDDYGPEIAGIEIHHIDLDDATAIQGQWVADVEARNARFAAADREAMAFIGPYNSGAARVSMPILNDAGLVQISPACTWPGLTKAIRTLASPGEPAIYRPSKQVTFCRVCPHDASQGALGANFAHADLKAKTVYIIDDKELYGGGIAALFEARCEELKVKVLGRESIRHEGRDYRAAAMKIKAAKPDLVYFGGTTQSGAPQLVRDMAAAAIGCPLVLPDGCYEKALIHAAGEPTFEKQKCYLTIGGFAPELLPERGAAFAKKYKTKHKTEPTPYAIYGYESAKVVLEAIRKVGKPDRAAIREAVLATKDFTAGALEQWSFDADGDTTLQQMTVSTVADGKFVPVKVVSS